MKNVTNTKLKILSAFIAALLLGCEQPSAPSAVQTEAWSNEAETLFQTAEALKYTLQQAQLEDQRLRDLKVDGVAPTLPR